MKFSTSKTELQKALQKLSKAIPTRSTLPILNSVFIKISETEASLKSTDLEIGIETKIPVSVEEEGSVCIPLKTLLNITSELPETRITIETDDKNKTIIITDFGKYDLMGSAAEEFPEGIQHSESDEMKISLDMLKKIIERTLFAVSKDELKPSLSGVCFEIEKNMIKNPKCQKSLRVLFITTVYHHLGREKNQHVAPASSIRKCQHLPLSVSTHDHNT